MFTAWRLLKHLWSVNKWEAFVLGEVLLFFWLLLSCVFHQYIQSHFIQLASIIISAAIADGPTEFFAWLLERKFALPSVVAVYSKTTDPIKKAIGNLIDHFICNKTMHNLYGNLMFFKLKPAHFPISRNDIGTNFTFIRHEGDFFKNATPTNLRESLKDFQIEDFSLIQSCIRKSWDTVAYGDINVLLRKKEYITKNIEMTQNGVNIKRLFIFPYWKIDGPYEVQSNFDAFKSHLFNTDINANDLNNLIVNISGRPDMDIAELNILIDRLGLPELFKEPIKQALVDAIYLLWLVKIHERFSIEYKILARNETKDGNQRDIIGKNFLRNESAIDEGRWKDEGSALIDNSVIVRFDDKMSSDGYIFYEFISTPDEVNNYQKAFETIWSTSMPKTYTIEEILSSFFSKTTAACLKDMNTSIWVELIDKELKGR